MVPNINYKFGAGTGQIEERLLTLHEWEGILERNGLHIKRIKQDKYFGTQITIKRIIKQSGIKGRLRLIRTKLQWAFMPLEETYQFIFICILK